MAKKSEVQSFEARFFIRHITKKHFRFVSDKLLMLLHWQYKIALFVSLRNRIKICLTREIHHCLKLREADDAEAEIVVTVARTIVVAIRYAAVTCTIVPAAATIHAVRAFPRFLSSIKLFYAFS